MSREWLSFSTHYKLLTRFMPPEDNKTELPEEKNEALKQIRTFKSDALEAVKRGGQSLTEIALAEQNRRNVLEIEQTRKVSSNTLLIVGASALFLLAIGILFFVVFQKSTEEGALPPASIPQEIIFAEQQKKIELSRTTIFDIKRAVDQELRTRQLPINTIETIRFVKNVEVTLPEETRTKEVPVGIQEILEALDGGVPSSLIRSLGDTFLFGFHSYIQNQPFLIIKTSAHANAFSGMLQWEKTMASDLEPLFVFSPDKLESVTQQSFRDAILKNRDTRVLEDAGKNIVLLYSFVNKEMLVVTTNETTFDELIKRIFAPREISR